MYACTLCGVVVHVGMRHPGGDDDASDDESDSAVMRLCKILHDSCEDSSEDPALIQRTTVLIGKAALAYNAD